MQHASSTYAGSLKSNEMAHLVQEGLEHIPRLGDCNDASCAGIVDTIMEVIDATCIDDLFPGDVWTDELPNARAELCHGSVILGTAE